MSESILVVAAHPDDEILGCGGAIARHIAEGDDVHILFMADGVGSREKTGSIDIMCRNQACDEALKMLGVTEWRALNFLDNRMDSVPLLDVVREIESYIEQLQPTRVYTHHFGDLNVDHRITHQAVITACRPLPGFSVREILVFEVLSSTDWGAPGVFPFVPNFFIDINDYLPKKLEALSAYEMEMRPVPHSRSVHHIEALAHHRGNCIGIEAAEAFQVIRIIN